MAGIAVGQRSRFFHNAHGADERRMNPIAGDGKILGAAKGLDAIVGIRRHLTLAKKIMFNAELSRCHCLLSLQTIRDYHPATAEGSRVSRGEYEILRWRSE